MELTLFPKKDQLREGDPQKPDGPLRHFSLFQEIASGCIYLKPIISECWQGCGPGNLDKIVIFDL